jgi:hypothetical protein
MLSRLYQVLGLFSGLPSSAKLGTSTDSRTLKPSWHRPGLTPRFGHRASSKGLAIGCPNEARQSYTTVSVWPQCQLDGFTRRREYYEAKVAERKHPTVVTGGIARKLAHLIFSLWTENRPFDPNYQWTAGSPK